MKRLIYFSLLISAFAGSLVFGMGLPQGHPREVDDVLGQDMTTSPKDQDMTTSQKQTDEDETVPEAWRGTWKVTVAYSDHETGALIATDVTTAAICPGEPIIPALTIKSFRCSANAADNEIGALCGAKHSPFLGCNVFVNTVLDSKREGEVWRGTGSWTAKVVGSCVSSERKCPNCEQLTFGEDFTVSGTRVSTEAASHPSGTDSFRLKPSDEQRAVYNAEQVRQAF
jgi:hypothetical protein